MREKYEDKKNKEIKFWRFLKSDFQIFWLNHELYTMQCILFIWNKIYSLSSE